MQQIYARTSYQYAYAWPSSMLLRHYGHCCVNRLHRTHICRLHVLRYNSRKMAKSVNHTQLNDLYVWMSTNNFNSPPRMVCILILVMIWNGQMTYCWFINGQIYSKNVNCCQSIEFIGIKRIWWWSLNKWKKVKYCQIPSSFFSSGRHFYYCGSCRYCFCILFLNFFCKCNLRIHIQKVNDIAKYYNKRVEIRQTNRTKPNQTKLFNSWIVSPLPFGHTHIWICGIIVGMCIMLNITDTLKPSAISHHHRSFCSFVVLYFLSVSYVCISYTRPACGACVCPCPCLCFCMNI